MDTVHEENSNRSWAPSIKIDRGTCSNLQIEPLSAIPSRIFDGESLNNSLSSSRRASVIIEALRRPSQAVILSAAQVMMNQKRLFHGNSQNSISYSVEGKEENESAKESSRKRKNVNSQGDDALTTILSALYAKLLVVLGMAFPITEIISKEVTSSFYQGFYLYLYLGSISFLVLTYATLIREKAVDSTPNLYKHNKSELFSGKLKLKRAKRYGSFYLRLGAIAFGIGSMVHSGLIFGRYFELQNYPDCNSTVLQAITPATRMILTLLQVQFIFLNSKDPELYRHKMLSRFGLMHMIAANVCEWLYVLVEETKHEIIHLGEHYNGTTYNEKFCQEELVMGALVANTSPFLFPCTIEYSLICAVILFEMWKKIKIIEVEPEKAVKPGTSKNENQKEDKAVTNFIFNQLGGRPVSSDHHFTVDCSNAHKGLFAGIMVIVLTIISLIMFFVLSHEKAKSEESKRIHSAVAEFEVNTVELILYIITIVAVIVAMVQMRALKYDRKTGVGGQSGIGLDNTLLVVAQTGVFIYCMFSIIGSYFTMTPGVPTTLLAEIFSFIQTSFQTMFVLDSWWRRCKSFKQTKTKPGRELITFLIIANMAMWSINTLEKNRAEFRPSHLKFFGNWTWTIITHISMPLAIFYRFHSTICLFEIWKSAYKLKSQLKMPYSV